MFKEHELQEEIYVGARRTCRLHEDSTRGQDQTHFCDSVRQELCQLCHCDTLISWICSPAVIEQGSTAGSTAAAQIFRARLSAELNASNVDFTCLSVATFAGLSTVSEEMLAGRLHGYTT